MPKTDSSITKSKILTILKKNSDYISGENISTEIGISRAAVCKNIHKLISEGYEIESVTNKGYRLISSPDVLSPEEISDGLKTDFIGKNICFFEETNSTNTQAKLNPDNPDGCIFIAESQSSGKGRLGRNWSSPVGKGIWFSILLKPDLLPAEVPMITLVAGLSVCRVIRNMGFDAQIKWPNDIVINGKKVCGILTEMSAEIDRVNYVVCGIGINANIESFDSELESKATSLFIESGKVQIRKEILQNVLYEFEKCYTEFIHSGITPFLKEYKQYCVTLGKEVRVIKGSEELIAEAVDIDKSGNLLIKKDNKIITVSSGEVSVRGIFGYV